MAGASVRHLSDGEQQALSQIMAESGGDMRGEYHERLAEWRHAGPVHELNLFAELGARSSASLHDGPVFSVFSYSGVVAVNRDPVVFSSEAVRDSFGKAWGKTIITEDDPEHRAIKTLAQPLFTRKQIEEWTPTVFEPVFRRYLDAIYEQGKADLHQELLLPFPVAIIHELMGLDHEEQGDRFHRLAVQLFAVRNEDPTPGLLAAEELFVFFSDLIEQRRKELRDGTAGDNIVTRLVAMNDDLRLVDDAELARFLRILLPGGADTTTHTTGNMFVSLVNNPDQLAKVRENPKLIDTAVDESIRYDVISAATYRGATQDVEVEGVHIPAGSMVISSISSANRDERRWDDPNRFDVTRPPGGHVGFGHGLHLCLGHVMARAEMAMALRIVNEKMPRLRPDPDHEAPYVCGVLYRHPGSLRVVWD